MTEERRFLEDCLMMRSSKAFIPINSKSQRTIEVVDNVEIKEPKTFEKLEKISIKGKQPKESGKLMPPPRKQSE